MDLNARFGMTRKIKKQKKNSADRENLFLVGLRAKFKGLVLNHLRYPSASIVTFS